MPATDVHEDLDALDLSEPETDPRTRHAERSSNSRAGHSRGETSEPFDKAAAREASLRHELDTVKNMNQVIEGVLESLERAKSNMGTVSRTVDSASTLLNTWTRILAQTEKNQRLILNPNWQGASQDIADIQQEEMQRRREAEMRKREEQERREALARKAEEDRKKAEAAASRGTRRTVRGTTRPGSRIPSTYSQTATSRRPTTTTTASSRGGTSSATRGTTGLRRPGYASGRTPGAPSSRTTTTRTRGT
ncbi:hypothetical protein KEM55_002564 [Ascosphaera atra]|nr:hypothetical protein KEM55_002564 [Ascosphaera atra]